MVAFATRIRESEPPASARAKAARYVRNQSVALGRFLEDGALPVDNTLVERRLRPIAVAGTTICSGQRRRRRARRDDRLRPRPCALVGAEPRAHLTDVLTKTTGGWPRRRLDELLPPEWLKSAPDSARVPPSR